MPVSDTASNQDLEDKKSFRIGSSKVGSRNSPLKFLSCPKNSTSSFHKRVKSSQLEYNITQRILKSIKKEISSIDFGIRSYR